MFTREFMTQLKERGVDQGHIININRYKTTPFHPLQMQFFTVLLVIKLAVRSCILPRSMPSRLSMKE